MNGINQLSFGSDMGMRTATTKKVDNQASFSNIFQSAIADAQSTDAQFTLDNEMLMTGQADDLAQITIDANKAQTALTLVVNLRDKAVDAYKEVMQMSL